MQAKLSTNLKMPPESTLTSTSPRRSTVWAFCSAVWMLLIGVYLWNNREFKFTILLVPSECGEFDNNSDTVISPFPDTTTTLQTPAKSPTVNEDKVSHYGFVTGKQFQQDHIFDPKLSQALTQFFKSERDVLSILELGAGRADYAKMFKSEGFFVSCYDGYSDTQQVSEGNCGIIDFSQPIDLAKHDWVLSLQVGGHIQKQFEANFISSIDKGNKKGVVISWAVKDEPGSLHVNKRNNAYIRERFSNLGYTSDFDTERVLRNSSTLGSFKNTLMVYRKKL